jgi:hypothetical protein
MHVARIGERRGTHGVLVGKPEGKIPFVRPRHGWEDNFKMDIQEVGLWHGLDCPDSKQGQVAGTCKRRNKPSGFIKYGEFLD